MSDTEAFTMPDDIGLDDLTTKVGNLDLANGHDRLTLQRALADPVKSKKQRWGGLDDEFRTQAVKAQKYALKLATERGNVREIDSCVRTIAMLEGQQQADEHLADKNARLDAGQATENQGIQVTYVNRIHAKD